MMAKMSYRETMPKAMYLMEKKVLRYVWVEEEKEWAFLNEMYQMYQMYHLYRLYQLYLS